MFYKPSWLELRLKPGKYYGIVIAKDKNSLDNPNIFYIPSEEFSFEIK